MHRKRAPKHSCFLLLAQMATPQNVVITADGIYNTDFNPPRNPIRELFEESGQKNLNYVTSGKAINLVASQTSTTNLCGPIVQGTGIGQRIGYQIRPRLLEVQLSCRSNISGTSAYRLRVVIMYSKYAYDSSHLPAMYNDVLILPVNAGPSTGVYNPDRLLEQNTILYDSGLIYVPSVGLGTGTWSRQLWLKIPEIVTNYKGNTGTSEDVTTNNIWILWHSENTITITETTCLYYEH